MSPREEPAIGDHALIGDTRTAALVSSSGSIDWMCVPSFEGPPVFGRLLDPAHGGSFDMSVHEPTTLVRRYRPDSAILERQVTTPTGTATITEGMVADVSRRLLPPLLLVRHATCHQGSIRLRVRFDPQLGLEPRPPKATRRRHVLICTWGSLALGLHSDPPSDLPLGEERTITLHTGDSLTLVLSLADRSPVVIVPPAEALEHVERTDRWWSRWSGDIRYNGPYRDPVVRSLITLRLLTFSPSGAPVAAPTTSLPEQVGGGRNWDYRFSWIRDASIGITASLAAGKPELADSYFDWLLHASRLTRPRLRVLYSIYGTPISREKELWQIPGYRGSRPVRRGNEAATQHQLDIYGWVLQGAWTMVQHGIPLHGERWRILRGFADKVATTWRRPDAGIWEMRGAPKHHVHSKLMAWVALDRALKLATSLPVNKRRRQRWEHEREAIADDLRTHGVHAAGTHYVQHYGAEEVDAALLLLPVLGFHDEPERLERTTQAIRDALQTEAGVHRYRPGSDGLDGAEGVFLPCTFWMVEALAQNGQQNDARRLFEATLAHTNDVGLLAEEADPTGAHLGNFPLSFTHATLVQAAMALEQEAA